MIPFKFIGNRIWVFDVESVPDVDLGCRMLGLTNDIKSAQTVIDEMYDYSGLDKTDPSVMLKISMQKIISISFVTHNVIDGNAEVQFYKGSVKDQTESELLQKFLESVGRLKPQMVGYASSIFDMPLLCQRALVNGLFLPSFFERPDKPWEGVDYFSKSEHNIDLMYTIGYHATTKPKLHEIATACRIPGKLGLNGGDVCGLYLDGKFDVIEDYNQLDSITTYLLFLRCLKSFGHISPDQHDEMKQFIRFKMESEIEENQFYEKYLEEWNWLEALPDLTIDKIIKDKKNGTAKKTTTRTRKSNARTK